MHDNIGFISLKKSLVTFSLKLLCFRAHLREEIHFSSEAAPHGECSIPLLQGLALTKTFSDSPTTPNATIGGIGRIRKGRIWIQAKFNSSLSKRFSISTKTNNAFLGHSTSKKKFWENIWCDPFLIQLKYFVLWLQHTACNEVSNEARLLWLQLSSSLHCCVWCDHLRDSDEE